MGQHDARRAILHGAKGTKIEADSDCCWRTARGQGSLARSRSRLRAPLSDAHFLLEPDADAVRADVRRHLQLHVEDEHFFKLRLRVQEIWLSDRPCRNPAHAQVLHYAIDAIEEIVKMELIMQ
jgi:hypothetical protein